MPHTRAWSNATPSGSDNISSGDDEIRNFRVDVDERASLDHIWGSSTADDGYHQLVSLSAGATVSAKAGYIIVSGSKTNGFVELLATDTAGNATQITKEGYVNLDDARLENDVYLVSDNSQSSANINIIKVSTSNLLVAGTNFDTHPLGQNTSHSADFEYTTKGYVDTFSKGPGASSYSLLSATATVASNATAHLAYSSTFSVTPTIVLVKEEASGGQGNEASIMTASTDKFVAKNGAGAEIILHYLAYGILA